MNSAFNNQILAEKLRKLNNSQQSIETLSHWCIFHRKKARLVVETWDKQVRDVAKDQQTPLLYLANDILQNSRRRGGEFVTEFWRILPGTLKDVMEKGDERVHTVVFRLVDIWDERKVFGSRSRTLREELLGDDPPADLPEQRVKPSHTIRIKVPMGGIQEKLTSAYRAVSDVVSDEDATLGRCNAAVIRIEGLEKEATTSKGSWESQDFTSLAEELQEQHTILNHGVEQLEMCELARAALVSHLKEALREQESKLELIRTQLQTARTRADRSGKLRTQLLANNGGSVSEVDKGTKDQGSDAVGGLLSWPAVPFVESVSSVPDETISTKVPKAAPSVAAEVAAKLAASASSAQMLKSVLSSFVAGEASNSHPESAPSVETPPNSNTMGFNPEKRQRLNGPNEHGQGNEDSPNSYPQHSTPMLPRQSNMNMGTPHQPQTDPSPHAPLPQQTSLNNTQQAQIPTQPPPLLQPQPQQQYAAPGSNVHVPGFGYAPIAPNPPLPPPIMQRQFVGMPPPIMPMQPQQNQQPGQPGQPFQAMQPPPPGYYGQHLLPAHVPRQ